MKLLKNILKELSPYVIVVGSFAKGTNHTGSDIDLYIRRRPVEVLEKLNWYEDNDTIDEYYIDKVVDIFEKYDLVYSSAIYGQVHTDETIVPIDASYHYKIHKDEPIKKITVFGVEMDSTIDDKSTNVEDLLDME